MSHFKMAAEKHHNHTESEIVYCKRSKRYVMQNWKYFRFVVAILKDWFAVDSNSIYLASMSSASPKTYDQSFTSLCCEQHLPNWNYFRYLSAIFISGVMATPGDVNIINIEKVIPKNMCIAVGIVTDIWDEDLVIMSRTAYLNIWPTQFLWWLAPYGDPWPFTGPQTGDARTVPDHAPPTFFWITCSTTFAQQMEPCSGVWALAVVLNGGVCVLLLMSAVEVH